MRACMMLCAALLLRAFPAAAAPAVSDHDLDLWRGSVAWLAAYTGLPGPADDFTSVVRAHLARNDLSPSNAKAVAAVGANAHLVELGLTTGTTRQATEARIGRERAFLARMSRADAEWQMALETANLAQRGRAVKGLEQAMVGSLMMQGIARTSANTWGGN